MYCMKEPSNDRVIRSKDWDEDTDKRFINFFLSDDDGNIMWLGASTDLGECEELAFAPLDWAREDSGCTSLWYWDNGSWELL